MENKDIIYKDIIHKKYEKFHEFLNAMERARLHFEETQSPVDLKIYRILEDDFEMELEKIYLPRVPGMEKTLKEEFRELQEEVMHKKQEQIKEKERQMAEAQSREQMSSTVSS